MARFLSPQSRAALESLLAADAEATAPSGVERLRLVRTLIAELETDSASIDAVRDAERDGADWEAIAAAAGLRPAAAKWRWQGDDDAIAARHAAGRKRAARPSSRPADLPGQSVAEAAQALGVTAQAIYQQVARGALRSETIELDDGRRYKRVFLDD
ncbi:MAG TPA: hypothetical protein VFQ75_04720 [Candidatus Limnocylindrales bacterium]|nr:hypothetical protein [Candidatus Limnocylindrales bacterium]